MKGDGKKRFDWSLLLGYDVFISYKRGPQASAYTRNLRNGLTELGFKCFLDQDDTEGGVELSNALRRALRRSRLLVVLAEPDVLKSLYVPQEIQQYVRHRKGRVVPVNVRSFLAPGKAQAAPFDYLQTLTWLDESDQAFDLGSPGEFVLGGIRKAFGRLRVASISRVITWTAIATLATAAGVAWLQRQSAVREAEMALAQGYASDLNLAERAHAERDTPAVLEYLSRYEQRVGKGQFPEFSWRYLWNNYNGDRARLLQEGDDPTLAFAPDGKSLLTAVRYNAGTGGGIVRLWESSSGILRSKIDLAKNSTVSSVTFAPDGTRFAVTTHNFESDKDDILIFSTKSDQPMQRIVTSCVTAGLAFTRDGTSLIAPCSSGDDAPLQIWDWKTGSARFAKGAVEWKEDITAWTYSPDGKTLAVAYDDRIDQGVILPPRLMFWDLATRAARVTPRLKKEKEEVFGPQSIEGLSFSPDSRHLVAAHGSNRLRDERQEMGVARVWDVFSGEEVGTLRGHVKGVHAVAFALAGTRIVSLSGDRNSLDPKVTGSAVIVWDTSNYQPLAKFEQAQTGVVESLIVSPGNPLFALISSDGIITLADVAKGELRGQRRGHGARIVSGAFTGDGSSFATASVDGTVRLWDAIPTPAPVALPLQTAEAVSAFAASPTGDVVAMALADATVVLKTVAAPAAVHHVLKAPANVDALVFNDNGKQLVGHAQGALLVWDVDSGQPLRQHPMDADAVDAMRLSRDSRHLVLIRPSGTDFRPRLERWDLEAGRRIAQEDSGYESKIIAISEDGGLIATARDEGRLSVVEVRTPFRASAPLARNAVDVPGGITVAEFSPDGTRLALSVPCEAFREACIRILDAHSLKQVTQLRTSESYIHALAFDDEGTQLASTGYAHGMLEVAPRSSFNFVAARVRVWNLANATQRLALSAESGNINPLTAMRDSHLYFVPKRRLLAVTELNSVYLHDLDTGELVSTSTPAAGALNSISIDQSGDVLAVTKQPAFAFTGTVLAAWNVSRDAPAASLPGGPASAWSLAFSRDSKTLAVGCEAGSVRLYDVNTGAVTQLLEGPEARMSSLEFEADGRTLQARSADGAVHRWNLVDGKKLAQTRTDDAKSRSAAASAGPVLRMNVDGTSSVVDSRTGLELAALRGERGIRVLAVASDGLIAAGAASGRVILVRPEDSKPVAVAPRNTSDANFSGSPVLELEFDGTGEQLAVAFADGLVWVMRRGNEWFPAREFSGHMREVRDVAFSPDGNTLASADANGRIVLWNVGASEGDGMRAVLRRGGQIWNAQLSPDGKTLAAGGDDKVVQLWDLRSNSRQAMLLGHTNPIGSLAFDRAGSLLASASSTEAITWDVHTYRRLETFEGGAPMHLSADGKRLATTFEDKSVAVWRAGSGGQLSRIGTFADRPTAVALSGDGAILVVIAGQRATLWDAASGKPHAALSGFRAGKIAIAAISADGNTLATVGEQGQVDLWHTMTGRRLLTISEFIEPVTALQFSADDQRLVAATATHVHVIDAARHARTPP